ALTWLRVAGNLSLLCSTDPPAARSTPFPYTTLFRSAYQPENIGHFGLALKEYVHFTSPIRRYPDLIVHRGIRHVLHGGDADSFVESLEQLGLHCSFTERRAEEATRDALSWLKCQYMQ